MVFSCNIEKEGMRYDFANYEVIISNVHYYSATRDILKNGVHSHTCYEVCFVLKGKGYYTVDKDEYKIDENCMFIAEPFSVHQIISDENKLLTIAFFTFNIKPITKACELSQNGDIIDGFIKRHDIIYNDCNYMRYYFEMLSKYLSSGGRYGVKDVSAAMLMDAMLILSQSGEMQSERKLAQEVAHYINENICNSITVADLCNKFMFSQRSLFYFFKEYFDETPICYINRMRISASIAYLKMGYSVKQIADIFHFSDVSSYSRLFKKLKGISPRQYLK